MKPVKLQVDTDLDNQVRNLVGRHVYIQARRQLNIQVREPIEQLLDGQLWWNVYDQLKENLP